MHAEYSGMAYGHSSAYASQEFTTPEGTYQCGSEMCVCLTVFSRRDPLGRLTSTLRGEEKNSTVKIGNVGSMGIMRHMKKKYEEQNRIDTNLHIHYFQINSEACLVPVCTNMHFCWGGTIKGTCFVY